MTRMTKAELVEEVSRVSDLTKKHSEVIVDTVFQSIIDALHRGEKIELRGFGSFRLRKREPRKGRNPKTGDKVDVPPKRVPYFKPGKELKDLINKEDEEPMARRSPRRRRTRRRRRPFLVAVKFPVPVVSSKGFEPELALRARFELGNCATWN